MEFKLLLVFLLSHLCFDFVFQGNFIMKKRFPEKAQNTKEENKEWFLDTLIGNGLHVALHLIGLLTLILILKTIVGINISLSLGKIIILILTHFIIDEGKSLLYKKNKKGKNNIWVFLIDQFLHIAIIVFLSFGSNIKLLMETLKFKIMDGNLSFDERGVITACVMVLSTYGTGVFIKILIIHLSTGDKGLTIEETPSKSIINLQGQPINSQSLGARNGGFIIGLLERIFIILSILINYPAMIGFILTAKSIARLKKLSNDSFAEYFIIGNLLSFIPSIIYGVFLKYVLKV